MLHHNHSRSGSTVSIRRGDIVWARVRFPHEWWPALVLSIDVLGVLVSFFKHDIPRRYILESEVVPFGECFRSIMGRRQNAQNCDKFFALLDSALQLSGQRIISSLSCRCQFSSTVDKGEISLGGLNSTFQPNGVLSFVSKVAVWPWVDVLDFVDAIRDVSQVQTFRRYCAVKQKMFYKKTGNRGNFSKMHRYSSFCEKKPSFTQESGAAEPECESQIPSKTVEKNLAGGAIKSLSSTTPIFDENQEALYENQPLPVLETQNTHRKAHFLTETSSRLNSLSLNPFYMVGESLQSLKQSLLRFKNTSHGDIVDICFRNCSKMCKAQLTDNANRGQGDGEELCLTKKRKQLDQLTLCGCSFKRQRNETSVPLQIIKSGDKRDVSDVFISLSSLAECFSSSNGIQMDILCAFLSQSPVKLRIQNLCSNEGLYVTSTCTSSWLSFLCNASSSSTAFLKDLSCPVGFLEIGRVQETKGNADISKLTKMNEVDQEKCHSLTLKQSVARGSTKSACVTTHSSNCDGNARASLTKGLLEDGLNVDQIRLQISNDGGTAINLCSGDCMMENKDVHQSVTYYSVSNSNVGRQLNKLVPSPSTSLYMKFPIDFSLPSKGELIKKFGAFGSVDYLTTKVFQYTNSARVAFIHGADAMAAYLYSKRKSRFGQANVQFWLDPYEQKRKGYDSLALSSPSARNTAGLPLKSCLRKSNPLSKENRKKHYNVGFKTDESSGSSSLSLKSPSTGNSAGLPLKSCLKQSNPLSKKDGKKPYRACQIQDLLGNSLY